MTTWPAAKNTWQLKNTLSHPLTAFSHVWRIEQSHTARDCLKLPLTKLNPDTAQTKPNTHANWYYQFLLVEVYAWVACGCAGRGRAAPGVAAQPRELKIPPTPPATPYVTAGPKTVSKSAPHLDEHVQEPIHMQKGGLKHCSAVRSTEHYSRGITADTLYKCTPRVHVAAESAQTQQMRMHVRCGPC